MEFHQQRKEIEERILVTGMAIPYGKPRWFETPEFEQHLNAWDDLRAVYDNTDEIEMGIKAVSEFFAFTWNYVKHLRGLVHDASGIYPDDENPNGFLVTIQEILSDRTTNVEAHEKGDS